MNLLRKLVKLSQFAIYGAILGISLTHTIEIFFFDQRAFSGSIDKLAMGSGSVAFILTALKLHLI